MHIKRLKDWVVLQQRGVALNKLCAGNKYLLLDKDIDSKVIVCQRTYLYSIEEISLRHHYSNATKYTFTNLEEYPIELPICLDLQYKQNWLCMRLI